ncbi:MAG TPA: hypothetical protein VLA25_04070, partial [Methylotenera sp.]|nr:hypothetical protein [Methylotenera sp.]
MSKIDRATMSYVRPIAEQLFIAEIQRQKKKGEADVIGAAERAIDDAMTFQNVWDDFFFGEDASTETFIEEGAKDYAPWMQEIILAHSAGYINDKEMQKCYEGYEEAALLIPDFAIDNNYPAQVGRAFHWPRHSFSAIFWLDVCNKVGDHLTAKKNA